MTLEDFYRPPANVVGFVLNDTYEWATERPNFDTTFLESLQISYEKWNDLTEGQRRALYNICVKFENGVLDAYEEELLKRDKGAGNLRV